MSPYFPDPLGIINTSTCPLCNSDEESTSHLFLYCSFARAMWHGTTLAVQTSELRNISVQDWFRILLNRFKRMDDDSMHYLQSIFTTLWTMWNHRNRVVHEGIQPNPIEVILTAQNLSCRYHNILTKDQQPSQQRVQLNSGLSGLGRRTQILIKIAGRKRKKTNRCAYAYEAKNVLGNCIFTGTFSCAAKSALGATQEALMDAIMKVRSLGYQRILLLSNSSRLVQVSNLVQLPNWQEQTMVSDILSLQ